MRKWIRSYAIGNRIFDLRKIGRDKYRISQGSGRRALHKGSLAECSDFIEQEKSRRKKISKNSVLFWGANPETIKEWCPAFNFRKVTILDDRPNL